VREEERAFGYAQAEEERAFGYARAEEGRKRKKANPGSSPAAEATGMRPNAGNLPCPGFQPVPCGHFLPQKEIT